MSWAQKDFFKCIISDTFFCCDFSFVLFDLIAWYLMDKTFVLILLMSVWVLFSNFKMISSFLSGPWFNGQAPDHSTFYLLLFHLRRNRLTTPAFENEFLVTTRLWKVVVYLANIGTSKGLFPPDKWLRADRGQMHIQEYHLRSGLLQILSRHSHTHS